MIEHPKAIAFTRGEQLKAMWRLIRRSWLIELAHTPNGEDRFPLLSDEDRRFVQSVRIGR